MSRVKVRKLKGLVKESNKTIEMLKSENVILKSLNREAKEIVEEINIENEVLKKRILELEESCENFIEVERNLHKKIELISKPRDIRQRLISFFS